MQLSWAEAVSVCRNVLEMGAWISTIAVAVFAWRALAQVRIAGDALTQARADLQVRSRRESITLATDMVGKFGRDVLPLVNREMLSLVANGIGIQDWKLLNSEFVAGSIADAEGASKWVRDLAANPENSFKVLNIMNELEVFAMPFGAAVADESVAFRPASEAFVQTVKNLAPYYVENRERNPRFTGGRFEYTVDLFKRWQARIEEEKLLGKEERLKLERQKLPRVTPVKPIGTE
jgi:hypothetical protein